MGTKHKHAEVIKAWADGEEIEFLFNGDGKTWRPCHSNKPGWDETVNYRVKTKNIVLERCLHISELGYLLANAFDTANCRMTFDPITRQLIDVEMIK